MKNLKKSVTMALLLATIVTSMPNMVKAENVKAVLPKFNVTLNGVKTDSTKSKYPMIVYNGITYFPMTFDNTRFLGVNTKWSEADKELTINQIKVNDGKYNNYNSTEINKDSYDVEIPTFKIVVNGKKIDNKNEKYPILNFRGITYFPLTWRFAVNEFGWKYSYNDKDGLVIDSVKKEDINKEEKEEEKWEDASSSIFYNGYYYQIKKKGDKHRLFKEALVGGELTMLSDMEIKDFKQEGDNLVFTGKDNILYAYNLKEGKIKKLLNEDNIKDGKVLKMSDEIFYANKKDDKLYNKYNKEIGHDGKVKDIEKVENYAVVTFESDNSEYKFIVYNSKGEEVYKSKKRGRNFVIEKDTLKYYDIKDKKTRTVDLKNADK